VLEAVRGGRANFFLPVTCTTLAFFHITCGMYMWEVVANSWGFAPFSCTGLGSAQCSFQGMRVTHTQPHTHASPHSQLRSVSIRWYDSSILDEMCYGLNTRLWVITIGAFFLTSVQAGSAGYAYPPRTTNVPKLRWTF
jgi:hypothetical protein